MKKLVVVRNEDSSSRQEVLTLKRTSSKDSMEIVRLYKPGDLHRVGLEKNYRQLVNMECIAQSLAKLLESYITLDKLGSSEWDTIVHGVYKPFIDKRIKFEAVDAFINGTEGDMWV